MPVVVIHKKASVAAAILNDRSAPNAFLKPLDIEPERTGDEYACDVDTPQNSMEARKALAKALGELRGTEQKSTRSGDSVGQQPPLEWLVVLPDRIVRMDEEALVVTEDVGQHQAKEDEQQVFERNHEVR